MNHVGTAVHPFDSSTTSCGAGNGVGQGSGVFHYNGRMVLVLS